MGSDTREAEGKADRAKCGGRGRQKSRARAHGGQGGAQRGASGPRGGDSAERGAGGGLVREHAPSRHGELAFG